MKRSLAGSFAAGALLMYFTDRNRGRRRRAVARDQLAAAWRDVRNELDKAGRDVRNRSHGIASAFPFRGKQADIDGPAFAARVRSAIGRAVSHPHALCAAPEENGRIVLEGPVLEREVEYLLKRVKAVPGVKEVINRLDVHRDAEGISSLQGGVARRGLSEFAQQNWTPSLRVASGALASAALYSGIRNREARRWAALAAGTALLARAVANRPLRDIFGLGRGAGAVTLEKTLHIDAPLEEVYAFWTNVENFPKFMTHLKEVRQSGDGRSHWVGAGPGGISIPWDAEITEQRTNEMLSWASVPGSIVQTAGTVRFDRELSGGTRVQIRMSYCPPAGLFGHTVAWLFGADPKSEMDDDLVRLKSLLEHGKTRAHGEEVRREEIVISQPGPERHS